MKYYSLATRDGRARPLLEIPCASRCMVPSTGLSNGTDTSSTYRIKHKLEVPVTEIRLKYSNYYNLNGIETVGLNDIAIKAAVETPDGFTLPVFFSGKRSATIEPGGTITSDPVSFYGNVGDFIFTRNFVSVTAGQKWPTGWATVTADGEGRNVNADNTDSGAITATAVFAYGPVQIAADADSVLIPVIGGVGDSILAGTGDTNTQGFFYRAFTGVRPHQRVAFSSEQAFFAQTSNRINFRWPLIRSCTHIICQLGVNDVKSAIATATTQANLVTIWKNLTKRGVKVYQTTITPVTTSTDSFATTANQTVSANEANRIALNTWIRAGAPLDPTTLTPVAVGTAGAVVAGSSTHPLTDYLELADAVETSRNSGIWRAPSYTSDGTHPLAAGATAMAAAINLSAFTLP